MGFYSKKYVHSVTDFLSAGRVCGRYVICASDVANTLSIITLAAYVEAQYKCGFALGFWMTIK
jgi:Na+/proline symporter